MSYRDIPEDRILKFPSTAGFKGWKDFFTKESTTHPAKMNLKLLRWILQKYTKTGDTVLDPMAGTGSTAILASLLGRHGVAVEFEPQFCKMIDENINRTRMQSSLMSKGTMTYYQGDARKLSKLLEESDAVVTSPPYEGSIPAQDEKWLEEHWNDESESPKHKTMRFGRSMRGYTKKMDSVISSPPYGNRLADTAVHDGDPARMGYRQTVDAVLTSPPYGSDNANLMGREDKSALSVLSTTGMKSVPLKENNIGNLKSESYLEAMLQVYRECHKVLKDPIDWCECDDKN